jgi:N-carbamoyl-L-amino-acid hydrolase
MTVLGTSTSNFAQKCFDDIRKLSADTLGVTRQGYSSMESAVLDYFTAIGKELNLEIERDPAGNVWMTLPGKNRDLPAIVSGSHADSVPQGGNYDGLAGIVAALCVAKRLREENVELTRDYRVLMIRMEESSFFGKCYVGTLAMTGQLTQNDLQLRHRTLDKTLAETMREVGCDPELFTRGTPLVDLKKMGIFLELHIEQGPTLDSSADERVGIVTGIRGNIRYKAVKIIGQTAHSGAVDKPFRHDAVLAFADFAHRLDLAWDELLKKGEDLVFTIGTVNTAKTAAISVVPGEVSFCVDMRSLSRETLAEFNAILRNTANAVEAERGVKFEFSSEILTAPFAMKQDLVSLLDKSAKEANLRVRLLPSGAGHDSCVFGNLGIPVGMIFVANQNGSHNPYEEMRLDDFMQGTNMLFVAVECADSDYL